MNTVEQLFLAFKAYGSAFRYLDKYRLWKLIILPSILSLIIAIVVGVLAWITADDILLHVFDKLRISNVEESYSKAVHYLIVFIIRGITLFLYLKLYRYLILVFLSPIYVNTARIIHDKSEKPSEHFNFMVYCFCYWRGIRLALRNFMFEMLLSLLLIIASIVIIWISPLLPFLMLLIESYYFGIVMMDYNYEMKGLNRKNSSEMIQKNWAFTLGNGLVFNLLLLIPVLGVVFAPFFAIVAAYSGMESLKK